MEAPCQFTQEDCAAVTPPTRANAHGPECLSSIPQRDDLAGRWTDKVSYAKPADIVYRKYGPHALSKVGHGAVVWLCSRGLIRPRKRMLRCCKST